MQETELYERIRRTVEEIPIIDTHEHLLNEKARLSLGMNFFHLLFPYASSDLVSAGMAESQLLRLTDNNIALDKRWAEFAPFWKHVRTTGYGRALLIAARDLFGIDDINDSTYAELSEKIAASNRAGWYEYILKERANIEIAILDTSEEMDISETDRRLFAPVIRLDDFIIVRDRKELEKLERKSGLAIHSIDDMLRAMDTATEKAVRDGIVGIKIGLAYLRTLHFEKVTKNDAERAFNEIGRYPNYSRLMPESQPPPLSWSDARPMQDFLAHHLIRCATEHGLPIQVHTGLQEGNGNFITNASPLHLVDLFLEYPRARFDIFHAGYPWVSEAATLGKNFTNVYLNMCWLHVISPWVARRTLHEWIETVPANKILGFGGDYTFVEGTYSHSRIARDDIAEVLSEKVARKYLTEGEAMILAQRILRENAVELFNLRA
jgi:predicted TIM-barrel fold metal-dependent hydrolase